MCSSATSLVKASYLRIQHELPHPLFPHNNLFDLYLTSYYAVLSLICLPVYHSLFQFSPVKIYVAILVKWSLYQASPHHMLSDLEVYNKH